MLVLDQLSRKQPFEGIQLIKAIPVATLPSELYDRIVHSKSFSEAVEERDGPDHPSEYIKEAIAGRPTHI